VAGSLHFENDATFFLFGGAAPFVGYNDITSGNSREMIHDCRELSAVEKCADRPVDFGNFGPKILAVAYGNARMQHRRL
jgi:hypothetical protein